MTRLLYGPNTHPPVEKLQAFYQGYLGVDESTQVAIHLELCSACAAIECDDVAPADEFVDRLKALAAAEQTLAQ